MNSSADKLANYLFDQIGKYLEDNQVATHEMITTLMTMSCALIGSLKIPKAVILEVIDRNFISIRQAIELSIDTTKQ